MTSINYPAIFNSVCRNFIQDYELAAATPEALIDFAIDGLDHAEMRQLNSFLVELLDGRHSEAELRAMWRNTSADIDFPDGHHLRQFLELMKLRVACRLV